MTVSTRLTVSLFLTLALTVFSSGASAQPAPATTDATPATALAGPAAMPLWITSLTQPDSAALTGNLTVATLENGMSVIIKVVRTSPVVDVRAYVHAGSMYESRWLGAGLSHLLEHLVAQGAEHQDGPGEAAKAPKSDRIVEIGGQSNAYTTLDHTCYYISASSEKTLECVDLVADWMARPTISKADFEREHGVVQRELEMGKDDPRRQIAYAAAANIYGSHPAGIPTIGYKSPLAAVTYQDVLDYHAKAYVPQNMTFVVVGDVDPKAVLARVRKDFADFKAQRSFEHTLPDVQNIAGVRRVLLTNPQVKEVTEEIAFLTVPLFSEDLYALDLLSTVLSEGQSSQLVQRLYRQRKLVTSIDTGSDTPSWGRGHFSVMYTAPVDKADQAQAAVLDELRSVIEKPISPAQLERAKRQKVAQFVYAQQTVDSQSATLGFDMMATGDVNFTRDYVDRIQKVTAAQLQAVAARYFKFDAMAITRMAPSIQAQAQQAQAAAEAQPKPQTFKLPNGLRVVLNPIPTTASRSVVSMVLASEGGLMLETPKTNGLGSLMANLTTHGAGKFTADDIAEFFDQAGGTISGSCGNNTINWQATVLDDNFDRALEIFASVVQHPTFATKELEIVRPPTLAAIERIDSNWQSQMMKYFRQKFFENSPYGMLSSGSIEVVKAATSEQLAAYHRQNVKAGTCVLTVFGRFDPVATRAKIEQLFKDLPEGKVTIPTVAPRQIPPGGQMYVLPTQNEVATVSVAAPGMLITNIDDRIPIDVLDTIISGWQLPSGWLHKELRGKQLVYVVHAVNWPGLAPGAFYAYAAGQPANARQVIDIIKKNFDKAAAFTPTQAQIDEAVNTILTAESLDNQEVSALALQAALDELWGLGYDFRTKAAQLYHKVTPADVARVGAKYLGKGYVVTVTTPEPAVVEGTATAPAAATFKGQ